MAAIDAETCQEHAIHREPSHLIALVGRGWLHAARLEQVWSTEGNVFGYFKKREFRKELEKALADGVLTDDEVKYLEERSEELGVDQQYVNKIRTEHFNKQVELIR